MQNEIDEAIIINEHYDSNPLKEWNRLEGFHFEFEITKFYLNKYLKKKLFLILEEVLEDILYIYLN